LESCLPRGHPWTIDCPRERKDHTAQVSSVAHLQKTAQLPNWYCHNQQFLQRLIAYADQKGRVEKKCVPVLAPFNNRILPVGRKIRLPIERPSGRGSSSTYDDDISGESRTHEGDAANAAMSQVVTHLCPEKRETAIRTHENSIFTDWEGCRLVPPQNNIVAVHRLAGVRGSMSVPALAG
jgi:hypothetical protein